MGAEPVEGPRGTWPGLSPHAGRPRSGLDTSSVAEPGPMAVHSSSRSPREGPTRPPGSAARRALTARAAQRKWEQPRGRGDGSGGGRAPQATDGSPGRLQVSPPPTLSPQDPLWPRPSRQLRMLLAHAPPERLPHARPCGPALRPTARALCVVRARARTWLDHEAAGRQLRGSNKMPGAHVRLSQWVWGCPLERLTRGLATEAGMETVGGCALRAEPSRP